MLFPMEKTPHKELDSQLALSILKYNNENLHSPELTRKTWEEVLKYAMVKADINVDIIVPDFNLPKEQLEEGIKGMHDWVIHPMGLYFPPELQGKKGRDILTKTLKAVGMKEMYIGNSLSDVEEQTGWLITENTLEAANLNSMPKEVDNFFARQGRKRIGLNQYLTLALFLRLTTGHFPDQNTVSFLSNSSTDGGDGRVRFSADGSLSIDARLLPGLNPRWGMRSVGVK